MDTTQIASGNYHSSSIHNLDFTGLPAYPSPARSESSVVQPSTTLSMYDYEFPANMRTLSQDPPNYTSAPHSTHPWSSTALTAGSTTAFAPPTSWSELPPMPSTVPGWNPAFTFDPSHAEPGSNMSPGLSSQPLLSDRSSVSSCEQSSGTFSREGTDPLFRPIKSEYPGSQEHPGGIALQEISLPISPPQAPHAPLDGFRPAKPYRESSALRRPMDSVSSSPAPSGRHSFYAHPPRKMHNLGPQDNQLVPRERRRREFTTEENAHFRCDICNRLFQRSYNYKKHMDVHDPKREKPHICECGKRFVRPADFKRHVKSVHDRNKDQKCELCGAFFSRRDTLRRHTEDGCPRRFDVQTGPQLGTAV